MTDPLSLEAYRTLIGQPLGVSAWHRIHQAAIDAFASVSGDFQFIHVDPERARTTSLGGTVAHGFLTVSLLSRFGYEVLPQFAGSVMSLNYGFDKLRFLAPVRAGDRIRGRFGLKALRERRPGEILLAVDATIEIEGNDKPALIAEWLGLHLINECRPS